MDDPMKKVLFLPKWYPNMDDPQLGIFIQKHAEAVAKHCKVAVLYVVSTDKIDQKFKVEITEDGNLTTVKYYYKKASTSLNRLFLYLKAFKNGKAKIDELFGTPDLIHVNVLTKPAMAARRYYPSIPYVVTEHWSGYITGAYDSRNQIKKYYSKKAVAGAKAVTVVSDHLKEAMLARGLQNNYHIVPNVIESSATGTGTPPEDKVIILSVADLADHTKNISGVIKCISNIETDFPFEYHIIGDGPDKNSLEVIAETLGVLNKKVFFLGRKDNSFVLDYMQKSHFVVVNSRFETFSMITAEALLSGIPVIATRCGGPEQFINEKTGLLIDSEAQDQLQEAIESMLHNYYKFDKNELILEVKEKYSSEAIGKQFYDIYRHILNG
jgi:glycosyltransferase involved in cell wall biosynthesis